MCTRGFSEQWNWRAVKFEAKKVTKPTNIQSKNVQNVPLKKKKTKKFQIITKNIYTIMECLMSNVNGEIQIHFGWPIFRFIASECWDLRAVNSVRIFEQIHFTREYYYIWPRSIHSKLSQVWRLQSPGRRRKKKLA